MNKQRRNPKLVLWSAFLVLLPLSVNWENILGGFRYEAVAMTGA
jgi:hypothetical protein